MPPPCSPTPGLAQRRDAVTGCTAGAPGSDTLSLSLAAADPATSTASVTYTVPTAGNTNTTAVYATGTTYSYAATSDAHHLDDADHYGGGRHGGCWRDGHDPCYLQRARGLPDYPTAAFRRTLSTPTVARRPTRPRAPTRLPTTDAGDLLRCERRVPQQRLWSCRALRTRSSTPCLRRTALCTR